MAKCPQMTDVLLQQPTALQSPLCIGPGLGVPPRQLCMGPQWLAPHLSLVPSHLLPLSGESAPRKHKAESQRASHASYLPIHPWFSLWGSGLPTLGSEHQEAGPQRHKACQAMPGRPSGHSCTFPLPVCHPQPPIKTQLLCCLKLAASRCHSQASESRVAWRLLPAAQACSPFYAGALCSSVASCHVGLLHQS